MRREVYLNFKYLFIIAICSIILSSCQKSPEQQLNNYIEYTVLENEGEKAYDLLSSEDQRYKTKEEFCSELKRKNIFNEKLLKQSRDLFNYEIIDIKRLNEDTVKIKVELTRPNTTDILQEVLAMAMATSLNKMPSTQKRELLEDQFLKIIKSEEVEVETEEREFILIRENGQYRIFLDFGHSHKLKLLNQKIEKLTIEAEEKERKIDFESALKIYHKIQGLKKDADVQNQISHIKEIVSKRIHLGEKIKTGNLFFTPEKIELRKVNIVKRNWSNETPLMVESKEPLFVLHFTVTNNCEGEVIEVFENKRFKRNHVVYDNFGNEMKEFLLDFDMISVEGYEVKKIKPGESRKMIAVCEQSLSPKATNYLWKVNVITDNKKTEDQIYIAFSKDQIGLQK